MIQAEIDAAAELVDFLRFNAFFAKEVTKYQPISEDASVTKNSIRMRGLEGFVAAVSPFNFTAIGGNLASAPTLMVRTILDNVCPPGLHQCAGLLTLVGSVSFVWKDCFAAAIGI